VEDVTERGVKNVTQGENTDDTGEGGGREGCTDGGSRMCS